jgi:hypothetical protein
MSAFWQQALHYGPREPAKGGWVFLRDPEGRGPNLSSGWVPSSGRPQPRIRTMGLPRGTHKQRRWSLTLWNGGSYPGNPAAGVRALLPARDARSGAQGAHPSACLRPCHVRSQFISLGSSPGIAPRNRPGVRRPPPQHSAVLHQQDRRDVSVRQRAELHAHTIDGRLRLIVSTPWHLGSFAYLALACFRKGCPGSSLRQAHAAQQIREARI